MMAQVDEFLPCTWETWTEFLDLGFDVVQLQQ